MPFSYPTLLALLVAFALWAPAPLAAQSDEDEQDQSDGDRAAMQEPDPDGPGGPAAPAAPSVTATTSAPATNNSIVLSLTAASGYCSLGAYAVDCLSERLGTLAKQMEGQEEFDEVRLVLADASKKLNAIARNNRSSSLAPARFTTTGETPVETTRRLIPVDETRLEIAFTEAISVLEEAQTLLLRSTEGTNDRTIQYQRISAAIGSNKVLLRST